MTEMLGNGDERWVVRRYITPERLAREEEAAIESKQKPVLKKSA